jgi:hypothetical protein
MVEADINHALGISPDEGLSSRESNEAVSSEYMLQRRRSFISFDVFREEYWGHFPQSLTKGLGPLYISFAEDALIFSIH